MLKKCKYCNQEFESKRWDAKYCGEKCKNTRNNQKKSTAYHIQKPFIKILWRNRMILHSYQDQEAIHYDVLKRAGFDFNFYTHKIAPDGNGDIFCCFDFGYRPMNRKTFKIFNYEHQSSN